jgi:uncharacterized membrane protein YgaE (UPF0421/DUF939 family)
MGRLRDPVVWTQATQLIKTVGAAVLAWVLARHAFHIAQPFLAPWAALLTVHLTVYRTFRRGAQQVAATVLGVLLAFAVGAFLGVSALSLALALLLALLAGAIRGLRAESTTAAVTALVVLTTGYSNDGHMLLSRLLDTGIGIAVGMLVNMLVWPPLRDRVAAGRVDAIDNDLGGLLCEMAGALRDGCSREKAEEWIARSHELDEDIDDATGVVRQARESGRLNPRRAARPRMRATAEFDTILERLEQAVAETRSMARTIRLERVPPAEWDPEFRDLWLELLERTGTAIAEADVEELRAVGADVVRWREERFWPTSGALLVNLRNILNGFDEVAEAQPVRVPEPALTRR